MSFRFRTISEVFMAWLLGAVLALLVFMWPTSEPCPHGQACPIVASPIWQILLAVSAFLGPGILATLSWARHRPRAT